MRQRILPPFPPHPRLCLALPQGHNPPPTPPKKDLGVHSYGTNKVADISKCRVYLQAVVAFKKLKITETSEEQRIIVIIHYY